MERTGQLAEGFVVDGNSCRYGMVRQEVSIILGILVICLSLVVSSLCAIHRRSVRVMVEADIQKLLRAGREFYSVYGVWPTTHGNEYGDFRYGGEVSNAEVLNVLRAVDAVGNMDHSVNPKRIHFSEFEFAGDGYSGLNAEGVLVDPWGYAYQIVMDTDLDGSCEIRNSVYGRRSGKGIVVWSMGADGVSGTRDDILSWEE